MIDLQSCQNGGRYRGIGRYSMSVAKEMIRSGKKHEFFIIVTDRFPGSISYIRNAFEGIISQDNILVLSLFDETTSANPEDAWRNRAAEILRSSFIARFDPDIVFIPSLFEGFWDNTVVSTDPSAYRSVVTLHDFIPLEEPERYLPDQKDRDAYARRLADAMQADLLVPISSYVANEARRQLAADPARLVVALNGIDARFVPPAPGSIERADLMKRMGIARPFVFNTSPLEYRKNLEGLIAAFASMSLETRKRYQIVVAGKMDDYARNYLNQLVCAEGLADDTLVLPGYISDDDLIALYAECSLFVFPSWSEGFGLPPLEAMACGAPVIAANTTSLPEVMGRADLLVDPAVPPLMGAAMERVLTDGAIQQELRQYGIGHARKFSWELTARTVLNAIEALPSEKPARSVVRSGRQRMRLAVIVVQTEENSHILGRVCGLVSSLSRYCDVMFFTPSGKADQWLDAEIEQRDLGWLDWNESRFDCLVYVGDYFADRLMVRIMTEHPGLYVKIRPLSSPCEELGEAEKLSSDIHYDVMETEGLSGLINMVRNPPDELQRRMVYGASFSSAALTVLSEGENGLPFLHLAADGKAAARYRDMMGVAQKEPLVIAIAGQGTTANQIMIRYRKVAGSLPDTHLVVHVVNDGNEINTPGHVSQLRNRICHVSGRIDHYYRGILSSADLILLGSDIPPELAARCLPDAGDLSVPVLTEAETRDSLGEDIIHAASVAKTRTQRPHGFLTPADQKPIDRWVDVILDAATQSSSRNLSLVRRVEASLPGSVRGKRATSLDLARLSVALEQNAAFERDPLICFDISVFASPGAIRRLDELVSAHLLALIGAGGRTACAVFEDGGHFVIANQFVTKLLGIRSFHRADEVLVPRSGDRIVGLDCLSSFGSSSFPALRAAQEKGAAVLYCALGRAAGYYSSCAADTADLVMAWASGRSLRMRRSVSCPARHESLAEADTSFVRVLEQCAAASMPIDVLAVDGFDHAMAADLRMDIQVRALAPQLENLLMNVQAKIADARKEESSLHYTVMGHLLGSYSLAIINRAVATSLERAFPDRTHFLPFETDPITHTEGVPASEQSLMIELCERPRPARAYEVMISQHWPILPPKDRSRLALSLFPWEETHVPAGIINTLVKGFDALISPARYVTNALIISGCSAPIATIGQPVDLAPFTHVARARDASRPIRQFVHISSCFPRKGVDVLLKAWVKAFTKRDGVRLLIKTFPNPHNDVEQQLAVLQQCHRDMAPVEIINRDAEREEMAAFYADYDVMVLPSRGEGYNLPALEAMASGLPLIVTGEGGHRDFCGSRQARMVRYRFARANSHVAASFSMWLEPDCDDLVAALREYAEPANRDVIERRREAALEAASIEGDAAAWTRRLHGVVHELLKGYDKRPPRVAWVSTWGIQCGIAQYSSYLLERFSEAQRRNTMVFCDFRSPAGEGPIAYRPVWHFIGDKASEIVDATLEHKAEALVIQHQDGLISWEQLGRIGNDPALAKVVTVVVLHNARNLRRASREEMEAVVEGLSKMSRVLVHNIDDMNFLHELGLSHNLGLFPHGAFAPRQVPWPRVLGPNDAPLIGCHGFFFRHKGIDKLIRAAAKLRREWPGLRLRLVNARFPGAEHDRTIDECRAIAAEVGMDDAIEWYFDFLPVEKIEALLSECDLIALPYDESDDSASGAVRTALASMVPLVATRVQIFAELGNAAAWASDNDPDELVRVMSALLKSPERRREVQAGIHDWLSAHDWNRVSGLLEDMLAGLVRQTRLGWDKPRNIIS
ncbi:glycosyltransferase [Gluconacetobacter liquefaciens]|nr:glycosyltransferase [Gluconacetobacter liquefaciens]